MNIWCSWERIRANAFAGAMGFVATFAHAEPAPSSLRQEVPSDARAPLAQVRGDGKPIGPTSTSTVDVESATKADVWSLLATARFMRSEGQCEAAIALYTRVLTVTPSLVAALQGRAECLSDLQRGEEAVADYEAANRLSPGSSDGWGSLGWELIKLGRFAEAEAAGRHAAELSPLSYEWPINLGHARLFQGDVAGARSQYQAALVTPGTSTTAASSRPGSALCRASTPAAASPRCWV